ncbi:SHOCT domain-containing protein [Rhodococcus tukisamuensis]|uniref:Short C-terminal domain-containing protein n=1 Tax=Rhodococcus tukisamuensis TaxID=168276 RepID=A0A1G6MWT1_9NOCA|nr:SHOCT domain-containing protein [Rhodococcus tukisamuensis]SDC59385.1 Short C-terminal domain-containing protein [Rhodococcus tukisamuensis]
MVFRARRVGRPGLLGTVARTAVVAGTAQATSNAMNRRSQRKAEEQQAYADQQAEQQAAQQQAAYAQQVQAQQAAAPAAAPAGGDDLIAKLQQLGQLRDSGVLTDDEFAAAKAKLLG